MKKLYIANRGEIACRVIRTAKKMGIATAVGYSDADKDALFVKQAGEAFHLGAASPADSYLNMDRILEVIAESGAEAVHPGYGFLSENAEFVRKLEEAGVNFVGPSAAAIDAMGHKERARNAMAEHGVPLVPGSQGVHTVEAAAQEAQRIGYPVMLKASLGGGGIGMQAVQSPDGLEAAVEQTVSRAERAFGSGEFFVEKLIEGPHHVEVQVFGSSDGSVHTVFERECSVQRRHQKIAEEAPSPFANDDSRSQLFEAALKGAKGIGYVGAGTMEFLLGADQNPYFLEMNTRLQVEHPVTEMITGLDLVELQLRTAMGEDVSSAFDDLSLQGHALEFRLYAENPKNFFPAPGTIDTLQWPEIDGVRIDTGVVEGDTITPFYDPMIAKIIAHGDDRAAALGRMKQALEALVIEGLKTNHSFLLELVDHPPFVEGNYDTNVVYDLRPKLKGK